MNVQNPHTIKTGLVPKHAFIEKAGWFSMLEEDLKTEPNAACKKTGIFLECDYPTAEQIFQNTENLEGCIKTGGRIQKVKFALRKDMRYLTKIEEVKTEFVRNEIPWETVWAPYAHRMAEIELLPEEKNVESEAIEVVKIDWKEYASIIKYNMLPIWNVCESTLSMTESTAVNSMYPVFSNQKEKSFIDCLYEPYGHKIKTKSELIRRIESMDIDDYLIFRELRLETDKKQLYLEFDAMEGENIWNLDVLQLVISKLQGLYPEYEFVGKLQ